MTDKHYDERLAAWGKSQFSPPPEPPFDPIEPTAIEKVPMRDGVRLYTEIFLPNQSVAYPVILIRSPYPYARIARVGRRLFVERYLAAGYAIVEQLTRGQGLSEGCFRFFRDDVNDGYDAIQWVSEQAWCDGNVGMQGSSYLGSTQLLAARTKPPALKCIMPTAFVGNCPKSFPFSYGVPNKGPYMQWHQVADAERMDDMDCQYCDMNALNHPKWGPALRHRPLVDAANGVLSGDKLDNWRETISHPLDDDYWAPVHFTDEQLAELDIPVFITDGWYDMTFGPIDYFTRLEQIQPNRHDRYLLVGPWNHYQTYTPSKAGDDDGDRILPENGAIDLIAQRIAFFDRYLKDDKAAIVQEDRVRIYIAGTKGSTVNRWFDFPTFPVPGTLFKRLYLHSQGDARTFPGDGVLHWEAPTSESAYTSMYKPTDTYTYDPALPTASLTESYQDRRNTEIRSDVLTYTSALLTEPLTILGDITLVLHAASDAPDTDWFAVVTEVKPDGQSKSFHYAPPAFRARYREGFDREVFLTPNKPEEFTIPMGPAGHQIAVGNCLRLSIFSSAFPEYAPNTNTGKAAASDTEQRIARQTLYHDAERLSYIVLPIIDLK